MAENSSKASKPPTKVKISGKPIKRTLQGLIFYPKKTKGIFIGIKLWVEAGQPDNASIFDNADTLLICGIPICDGVATRGMYQKIKARKARPTIVKLIPHLIRDLNLPVIKTTVKGIEVAETKAHNVMKY